MGGWWAFSLRPNAVHRLFDVPVCIVSPVVDVQVKCNVQIEYMCNNCACALLLNRPSTRPDGPGRSQIWSEAAGTRLASATAVGPGRASPSCVFYRHLLLPRTITLGDHRYDIRTQSGLDCELSGTPEFESTLKTTYLGMIYKPSQSFPTEVILT